MSRSARVSWEVGYELTLSLIATHPVSSDSHTQTSLHRISPLASGKFFFVTLLFMVINKNILKNTTKFPRYF